MICSSVNLFFTSNLLSYGIGLQSQALLKSGGTSAQAGQAITELRRRRGYFADPVQIGSEVGAFPVITSFVFGGIAFYFRLY